MHLAAQPFYIASVFIFPIPIFRFHADYGGIKDRIFRFSIILRGFHHIAETYIKHRDIAIYDDDIPQIGERPQVGQVIFCNIAEYAKAATKTPIPRIKWIKGRELEIRFAEISEKVINPITQVYANRQKQIDTKIITSSFNPSGVMEPIERRNFGYVPAAFHASGSIAHR